VCVENIWLGKKGNVGGGGRKSQYKSKCQRTGRILFRAAGGRSPDRSSSSTEIAIAALLGADVFGGNLLLRSTLGLDSRYVMEEKAGRVIFSSITHRVTSPGGDRAGVRRGESATYVEPERTIAADDGRTCYFQTWPLLRLETLPVPPCPFCNETSQCAREPKNRPNKTPPVRFSPFPVSCLRPSTLCLQ